MLRVLRRSRAPSTGWNAAQNNEPSGFKLRGPLFIVNRTVPSSANLGGSSLPATSGGILCFPLSAAQLRMWQAYLVHPEDASYNGSFRMNLAGPVDSPTLQRTLREIARRHDVFRAVIRTVDGEPSHIISDDFPLTLNCFDLRMIPGTTREAELDRICLEDAQSPFDLHNGPLLRAGLIRMEDQRFVLTLTLHQIICDGWSIGLIMEELQRIYPAIAENRLASLPAVGSSFREHVLQQCQHSSDPEIAKQLEYWKGKLRGTRCLKIEPDLPSPPAFTTKSNIISHLLSRELTDRLRALSTENGSTFFIMTLAACFLLLYRYTGEEDLAVGTPVAGRDRAEDENSIGQFVNHIVCRAQAGRDFSFLEFSSAVREMVWEALANQEIPFEHVVRVLRPGTDLLTDPLYVLNFICQREYGRASVFNFDFAGIRMSTMPSKSQGALYDLNFFLVEREVGWRLSLEYKVELYSAFTARQMLDHFRQLLEGIAENPNRHLTEFPLTGESSYLQRAVERISGRAAGTLETNETYAMPASPVQQRFWLLGQLDPSNAAFQMPACVRITGPLGVKSLRDAFNALIRRHESLRTSFEEIDDELAQVIVPPRAFDLPVVDLTHLASSAGESNLQDHLHREAELPFNLETGPLFRAKLFRISSEEHVLLTTLHHILCDGWSQRVLQDDLWTLYSEFQEGRGPSQLAPLPIQYGDFTAWQRDWLASSEAQEQLEFWVRKLDGPLPILNFPTDRPATGRRASHGALETLLLPRDLSDLLKSFAQSHGLTSFVILLTAFSLLLSRRTQQKDLIIGSPVANRREETERLIGPFAGPVSLRLDLSGNLTLLQLVNRVRDTTFEALSRTDLPFEVLLEHLRIPTVAGRRALYQFYFFFQAAFLQPREVSGLMITPLPTFSVGIPFELQLGIVERQEGTRAQLEYNPDLYDPDTIRAILSEFENTVRQILQNPTQSME